MNTYREQQVKQAKEGLKEKYARLLEEYEYQKSLCNKTELDIVREKNLRRMIGETYYLMTAL